MKKTKTILTLATSCLLLAACGGYREEPPSSVEGSEGTSYASSEQGPSSEQGASASMDSQPSSSQTSFPSSVASSPESSSGVSSSEPDIPEPEPSGNVAFEGVETTHWPVGHYFRALDGVKATSSNGIDLSAKIQVSGFVDYGKKGQYSLTYSVKDGEAFGSIVRTIVIDDTAFSYPKRVNRDGEDRSVQVGEGSYRTGSVADVPGDNGNLFKRAPDPVNLDARLYNRGAIPSNQFFTGLMYGANGGSTALCMNTLDAKFASGISLSCRGTGFTQYFSVPDTAGKNQTTMENFRPTFEDLCFAPGGPSVSLREFVSDYSESSVEVSLRQKEDGMDELVFKGSESSPYAFIESRTGDVRLDLRQAGVAKPYEFYSLEGNKISETTFTGDGILIRFPEAHAGYLTSYPSTALGAPVYEDLWYLINAPEGTKIALSQGSHPNASFLSRIEFAMSQGNMLSVAAINGKEEASFYHEHGYSMPISLSSSYRISGKTVTTEFNASRQKFRAGKEDGLFALFPHQWKKSSSATSDLSKRTFRGTSKMLIGDSFQTRNEFYGVLPSFALPEGIDRDSLKGWIETLLEDTTLSDSVSLDWEDSSKDYANAPGPYWNAKAFFPLSQALIAADQIGEAKLRDSLKERLRTLMVDWYTYSGEGDVRYFFFDEKFGTMLYSTNNFSNNSRVSDHHFTSGYLAFASAVLAMYDSSFLTQYGDMAKLVLQDYMNDGENEKMPVLRGFDTYAGHSWADGIGDFGDGNDQESCGEALNSWTGGYLLAKALGDVSLANAAMYGFATEMTAIKQYWFNYDEDNWIDSLKDHTHVIGILWGGKNSCATWFGSNPEFIYGIHWLPTGEYLSNYVIGDGEKAVFQKIYSEMETKCGGSPRIWRSNMWAVEALVDPSKTLREFDASKIQGDDYKNELIGSYWMVNGLNTYGNKDVEAYFDQDVSASATVYRKGNQRKAMVWNPSSSARTLTYRVGGAGKTLTVPAFSFASYDL